MTKSAPPITIHTPATPREILTKYSKYATIIIGYLRIMVIIRKKLGVFLSSLNKVSNEAEHNFPDIAFVLLVPIKCSRDK